MSFSSCVESPGQCLFQLFGVIVKCCGRGRESGNDFGEDKAALELGVFGDFDEVHCSVESSLVVRGGFGEFEEHH